MSSVNRLERRTAITGKRGKVARPKEKIDTAEVEKLYGMQCTDEEVAAWFDVSARTIERRKDNKQFQQAMERGKAKGRVSLRRILFRLANAGNIAAAIFLAKNVLGYRDVIANEHSGPGGGPIAINAKPDFSDFSYEELQQLRVLAAKAKLPSGN